mgnify:FL=1
MSDLERDEGVGLAGRTWQSRQLTFERDLGTVTDCVRAPAARDAGVKSGVAFPIVVEGDVVFAGYGIAAPMAYPELRGWLSGWNEVVVEPVPGVPEPISQRQIRPHAPVVTH